MATDPPTHSRPRVSVVVPTRDRPALLATCLSSLAAQSLDPSAREVIVVDDSRAQSARPVAAQAGGGADVVRCLRGSGRGPAAARNVGWRAARAPIVAFTDDDCVPTTGWLASGLARFEDGVAGVSGLVSVPTPSEPTDYQRDAARLTGAPFITASCFYRRDALAEIGGFDERFEMAYREDSDVWLALLERGRRLEAAPAAVVCHPIRPAPWGVSLRQQRRSLYNALLYKKHPRLYRQRIEAGPPLRYYLTVAAGLAGWWLLARGRGRAATVALLVAAGQTGYFVRQRLAGNRQDLRHVMEIAITSVLIPPLSIFWRLAGACRYRVLFV
jgi:GT2 family glycosyltransferase